MVARVRAGDEGACETLFRTFHAPLWKFAYGYVRSREAAEEIVQEVFLALWRNRATWEVHTSVRAWLFGAVRHQALNYLRHERLVMHLSERMPARERRRVAAEADGHVVGAGMGAPAPDAQAAVEADELEEAVSRALAELPERRRVAMALRWKHDLSTAEIAGVLHTTPESVRVLLTRARQELAALLGRIR